MKKVRAHVYIEGRVQGVCFRMETQRAATARNLYGWVRNLPNGLDTDVKSMLKWCETGPPMARVVKTVLDWEPYRGDFDAFRITY